MSDDFLIIMLILGIVAGTVIITLGIVHLVG